MPNFSAFISYIILTSFTPGPNNIMSMSNASRYGLKRAIPFNVGVSFGFAILISLSTLFSKTLIKIIPSIKPIMTYVGALYILWLAWKTFTSKAHNIEENIKATNTFSTGFALQFVNVKCIIYALTITSTFITPYYNSTLILVGFTILLSIVAFLTTFSWAVFGSILKKFFEEHSKLVNIVMALLLVYTAFTLIFN